MRAAVVRRHIAVVDMLTDHSADLLKTTKKAGGVLELAARNGAIHACLMLCSRGSGN